MLTFKKRKDAIRGISVKCGGCGVSLDVNHSGICPYCGAVTSAASYDYVLTSITNL